MPPLEPFWLMYRDKKSQHSHSKAPKSHLIDRKLFITYTYSRYFFLVLFPFVMHYYCIFAIYSCKHDLSFHRSTRHLFPISFDELSSTILYQVSILASNYTSSSCGRTPCVSLLIFQDVWQKLECWFLEIETEPVTILVASEW
jgi:hypothetical protein